MRWIRENMCTSPFASSHAQCRARHGVRKSTATPLRMAWAYKTYDQPDQYVGSRCTYGSFDTRVLRTKKHFLRVEQASCNFGGSLEPLLWGSTSHGGKVQVGGIILSFQQQPSK